jgi:hypothetical protein
MQVVFAEPYNPLYHDSEVKVIIEVAGFRAHRPPDKPDLHSSANDDMVHGPTAGCRLAAWAMPNTVKHNSCLCLEAH